MMPMDSKKLINRFSWKRSLSAVFSQLHKIHFADIWLVSAYTVTNNRMKNLHRALKVSNQRVKRLQAKVDHLISSQSMCLQDSDGADVCDIVTEVSPVVEDKFPTDSPQRILWDQQKHYSSLRDNEVASASD